MVCFTVEVVGLVIFTVEVVGLVTLGLIKTLLIDDVFIAETLEVAFGVLDNMATAAEIFNALVVTPGKFSALLTALAIEENSF